MFTKLRKAKEDYCGTPDAKTELDMQEIYWGGVACKD